MAFRRLTYFYKLLRVVILHNLVTEGLANPFEDLLLESDLVPINICCMTDPGDRAYLVNCLRGAVYSPDQRAISPGSFSKVHLHRHV